MLSYLSCKLVVNRFRVILTVLFTDIALVNLSISPSSPPLSWRPAVPSLAQKLLLALDFLRLVRMEKSWLATRVVVVAQLCDDHGEKLVLLLQQKHGGCGG